jgi:type I restriction enzyme R subunit
MQPSPNFAFLKAHDLQLVRLGSQAERYFSDDPNTCLIKLRQFGELLAQLVAASAGLYDDPDEKQIDLLRRLEAAGAIAGDVTTLFHELRRAGNRATHSLAGEHRIALAGLKQARQLGIWFHRSYGRNTSFKPMLFVPPAEPIDRTAELHAEMQQLRDDLAAYRDRAEAAQAAAREEAELRQLAELLLQDVEAEAAASQEQLVRLQTEATARPKAEADRTIATAQRIGSQLELTEAETRQLIDRQLCDAGWEADTITLSYGQGARPQKGRNLAIAEWPTESGPADYVLFCGLEAIAVVEAKRQSNDVSGAIDQAQRYSRGVRLYGDARLMAGFEAGFEGGEYRVPFAFATNGRPFLEQLRTKSGIWFRDLRRSQNLRRPLPTWYSPTDLLDTLRQDLDAAGDRLVNEPFDYGFDLRDYQKRAIKRVEAALATGRRSLLLAMATGTGKTKTSITLIYRLLKTQRFRRILFLVDRTALGEQAGNAFQETKMESLQSFADIFEVKGLKDITAERETRVHIATVQSMVKRLLYPADDAPMLTAGQYDCIIIDECHRGYLLDRDLSDTELTFRDEKDYISKYRRVLDFFDAVKIGLTATPALHTTEIFGEPVFTYSYREAVIDGYLIDHEPPIQIKTKLAEEGMTWEAGAMVQVYDAKTGEVNAAQTPDEINLELGQFNRRAITEEFNRVVCEAIASYVDPALPGKTLIFCVNDAHADLVVDRLKQALAEQYGSVDDDEVVKITSKADDPMALYLRYKNEASPKIAVTVDWLTTGVDIPAICNLVFLRRVNSRILYEQMLGRATRLCPDIQKAVFRVFDAVRLYEHLLPVSAMKPVVINPSISFMQLVGELEATIVQREAKDDRAASLIIDQFLGKFQQKRRNLSEAQREDIERVAGMPIDEVAGFVRDCDPAEAAAWFRDRQALAQLLDRRDGGRVSMLISTHADELVSIEQGYGNADKPEDYLDGFAAFLRENLNEIPALLVVTQRPRELTREQLKELRLALDLAGYSETKLQTAWRQTTNEDIAASIVGFIRQAAIGDPLLPYGERVDRAMKHILAQKAWTPPQRQWLDRIGKQLRKEYIVDRAAMDSGAFRSQGGFKRIDKIFNGQLGEILTEISAGIWDDAS